MITKKKSRIEDRFNSLKTEGKKAFVTFTIAGDPDYATSLEIIKGMPKNGVDVIEIGMPFSDPMADGLTIQQAGLRALKAGQTMVRTLDLVQDFRTEDATTPIVLMGYFNPIYKYGIDKFIADALKAGVDGLIVVDMPPETDKELCIPCLESGLDFIRLATPTTDADRMEKVLQNVAGFVYYVSVAGVTGQKSADTADIEEVVSVLRKKSGLPIAVGFGISTPEQAKAVARVSDAVVVGSAIVKTMAETLQNDSVSGTTVQNTLQFVKKIADSIK